MTKNEFILQVIDHEVEAPPTNEQKVSDKSQAKKNKTFAAAAVNAPQQPAAVQLMVSKSSKRPIQDQVEDESPKRSKRLAEKSEKRAAERQLPSSPLPTAQV